MATSIFLAKLIGPVFLVARRRRCSSTRGAIRAHGRRVHAQPRADLPRRRCMTLPAGLAIVLDAQCLGRGLARDHHAPRLARRRSAALLRIVAAAAAPPRSAARMLAKPDVHDHRRRDLARARRAALLLRLFPLTSHPHGSKTMNKPISDADLATPEGHHRPDHRLAQDLRDAGRRARPARAAARDRARSTAPSEPPLPVYDTSGPYTDNDVAIDVEKGLQAHRASNG